MYVALFDLCEAMGRPTTASSVWVAPVRRALPLDGTLTDGPPAATVPASFPGGGREPHDRQSNQAEARSRAGCHRVLRVRTGKLYDNHRGDTTGHRFFRARREKFP